MSTLPTQTTEQRLETALRTAMDHHIYRYLMANTHGRCSGYDKATHHVQLSYIYVANRAGFVDPERAPRLETTDLTMVYTIIHDASQALTDYMDEVIGFPIDDPRPDYDALVPKFFDEFIRLADEAWDKLEIKEPRRR